MPIIVTLKTTAQIASAKGIFLTQVKENQPNLLKQCQALETENTPLFTHQNHEKAHGRLTSRSACVFSMETVDLAKRWEESGLKTVVVVNRKTLTLKTKKRSKETAYYISNCIINKKDNKLADDLVMAIRKHWGVESNNWILDVTFNEDNVRIKAANQAYIMGRLRSLALQLLRKAGYRNFQAALEHFADLPDNLEAFLRQTKFL